MVDWYSSEGVPYAFGLFDSLLVLRPLPVSFKSQDTATTTVNGDFVPST